MTSHLSNDQLVDATEGTLAAGAADHLEQCEACRARVTELRALLTDVNLSSRVPEPSPLFWDHLSRRVREATAAETVPQPFAWWHGLWRPLVAFGAAAAAVALVVLVRHGQPTVHQSATATSVVADAAAEPALQDDPSVDVVTAVVGDLSFDELRSADLVPSRATVDQAVSQLTEDQKRELMRLVREELGGPE